MRSPFGQKLGIPRQSGLTPEIESELHFDPEILGEAALRGIEGVSHAWLIWGFSAHFDAAVRDTVRPPRLGGQKRLGVLATRSPYRPNPLGLSLVELGPLAYPVLRVRGADLLDDTPVYDLKPYLPWAESIPDARCAWAPDAPPRLPVRFSAKAETTLADHPELRARLVAFLSLDPRARWESEDRDRVWATRFAGWEVEFRGDAVGIEVVAVEPSPPAQSP